MALIDCPACGHKVSDQAASCPSCGHPLRPVEAPTATVPAPPPAAPAATGRRRRVVAFAGVAAATFVLLLALMLSQQGPLPVQAPIGPGASPPTPPSLAAAQACEDKLREMQNSSLRTGQFPPTSAATVDRVASSSAPTYAVHSYFDIPGRGNQTLHTTYTCTVRSTGPDQWELVSLQMP